MLACPVCRKLYPSGASVCPEDGQALVPLEELPGEDTAFEPGAMVGEYRIERKLGAGTFGAVYAAEQPLIGKKVAVKVLHKKFASDASVVSRFVSEARAVNRIRHRNIIDIFSFGTVNGKEPYFVMEMLEGMTLRELLDDEKRLGVAEAIPILRGIADALDAAHDAGVTHRDLKPDNIFLVAEKGGGHFPKLLDFGVAKLVADEVAHKTATGAAIGTPSYMAPEQCRGQPVDHRADIYALGVVVHEMLTGRRLFQADSAMDVLIMHVSEPPQPMSEVYPDLPKALDAPVLAMLAKKPRDRPAGAGVAVAALAARAGVAAGGAAPEQKPEESSFERALARREAATVITRGSPDGAAVAATPSEPAPALEGTMGTSSPTDGGATKGAEDAAPLPRAPEAAPSGATTPSSLVAAATSDGRFALSSKGNTIRVWDLRTGQAVHTFEGQPGATPDAGTDETGTSFPPAEPRTRGGHDGAASGAKTRAAAKHGTRGAVWGAVAAGVAVLGVVAFLRAGRAPSQPLATPDPPPAPPPSAAPASSVTLRLTVNPPDADVMLDGLRAGTASEPLVLPRSKRRCALRIEKGGFEAQTFFIVPDHDDELPPIVLHAAPAREPGPPR